MPNISSRREFLQRVGASAAVLPFLSNTISWGASEAGARPQRLIVVFTPNGIVPQTFWPDAEGRDFVLKETLAPLEPFRDKLLLLHGVSDRVRGDGDGHMRGIGCLLTGIELFPGNIQGGSDTPAGWSSGLSIDQEIASFLQANPATRTRFGSLELGVMVPERADTWTRMVYAGPNKPLAPIDDPYQLFRRLYGESKDREHLASVLDAVQGDIAVLRENLDAADRDLLDQHATFVRQFEQQLTQEAAAPAHAMPALEPGVFRDWGNMPKLTTMQIDLLVHALQSDFTRVATLQITNSVGQARMTWLGIDDDHHALSHEPDSNEEAQRKLTQINRWYCEQLAYLAKLLAETPEPQGDGNMLDNTTIVWTNELGQGNSHTHDNTPFILVGGGLGFETGRSVKLGGVAHNRLLMSLAHGFGHRVETFGNADYCGEGPLSL